MKLLLLLVLAIIFFRLIKSSSLLGTKKVKKTQAGKRIEFQDAEYEEID